MRTFAKTKNVNIYSLQSPANVNGKVISLVQIRDNHSRRFYNVTGQSAWTILRDKKDLLRELNNSIIRAIENHLCNVHRDKGLNTFFRENKEYVSNKTLLRDMLEEYNLSIKLISYKVLHAVGRDNQLYMTKKTKIIREKHNNIIISRKGIKYNTLKKKDINEELQRQKEYEIDEYKGSRKEYNKILTARIREYYKLRLKKDKQAKGLI